MSQTIYFKMFGKIHFVTYALTYNREHVGFRFNPC